MNTLEKYLTINSIFSLLSGLTMLVFSKQLNAFFEITNPYILSIIGLNLLVFAAFVYYISKKQLNNFLLVNLICLLDALWVIGSVVIIIVKPFEIPLAGNIVIGVIATWIGFLGYKQSKNNIKKG